jgi:hypothetical protein
MRETQKVGEIYWKISIWKIEEREVNYQDDLKEKDNIM